MKRKFLIIITIIITILFTIVVTFNEPVNVNEPNSLSIKNADIKTNITYSDIDEGGAYVQSIDGAFVMFGHRTSHGAPLYNLDKVKVDDVITTNMYGKDMSWKVVSSIIVDASYKLQPITDNLYVITCTPLGSSSQRIIITATPI